MRGKCDEWTSGERALTLRFRLPASVMSSVSTRVVLPRSLTLWAGGGRGALRGCAWWWWWERAYSVEMDEWWKGYDVVGAIATWLSGVPVRVSWSISTSLLVALSSAVSSASLRFNSYKENGNE